MFGTIIAGCDGGGKGRRAVTLAAALAEATGDALVLVGIHPDHLVEFPSLHVGARRELHKQTVADVHRVRDELAPQARCIALPGISVAHGLRHAAEHEHAGLIVVGSAHRHGRRRILDGDHALQVMHGAPTAVLLVPDEPGAVAPIRRVTVAVDGSDEAAAARDLAVGIARACGADLTVMRAVDDRLPASVAGAYPMAVDWRDVVRERVQHAREFVDSAAERCDLPHARGEILMGRPVEEILRAGEDADLLVLGSRRWGTLKRLALGSTSEAVVRRASCPVLIPPRGVGVHAEAKAAAAAEAP